MSSGSWDTSWPSFSATFSLVLTSIKFPFNWNKFGSSRPPLLVSCSPHVDPYYLGLGALSNPCYFFTLCWSEPVRSSDSATEQRITLGNTTQKWPTLFIFKIIYVQWALKMLLLILRLSLLSQKVTKKVSWQAWYLNIYTLTQTLNRMPAEITRIRSFLTVRSLSKL